MSKIATAKKMDDEPGPAIEPKPPEQLAKRVCQEDHARRRWFVRLADRATKDDLVREAFWKACAEQFGRHDVVFALAPDESWEAELRVERSRRGVGCEMSVTKVMGRQGVSEVMTMLADDHYTEFRPGLGWCVIRVSDGTPVVKGHASEDAAKMQWLREQPRREC